jgi:sugar lactone lactonase YvrE
MSTTSCVICGKENASLKCEGCSKRFCSNHIMDHRQELTKQFECIEFNRNIFQEKFSQNNLSFEEIDEWEKNSIELIQNIANEKREEMRKYYFEQRNQIEIQLKQLTEQFKENREKNDFIEIDLNHWNQQLIQLEDQLINSSNMSIEKQSTTLIQNISLKVFGKNLSNRIGNELILFVSVLVRQIYYPSNINLNTRWKTNGMVIAEENQSNHLYYPQGIYINDDQSIFIADYGNHRIVQWQSNHHLISYGYGRGNQINQLNYPTNIFVDKNDHSILICDYGNRRVLRWSCTNDRISQIIISNIHCFDLTIDNHGDLYVSDTNKHEIRQWRKGDREGTIVAGGNGRGDHLNQLNSPSYIFIDKDDSLYISDWNNHRVMKWVKNTKEGIVVAGGHGRGDSLKQLSHPGGVIVDQLGRIYVADCNNNRVMRWCKDATEGSIIIGENQQTNQFNFLRDLSFDHQGNLYVVDYLNNRIQKFQIDSN